MAEFYYFNENTDKHDRHEVHKESCSYLPKISNRTLIGYEDNCKDAIKRAEREHPFKEFDGCFYCSYTCHKG